MYGGYVTDAQGTFSTSSPLHLKAVTIDRRDFSVYRTTDGRALDIVPEP